MINTWFGIGLGVGSHIAKWFTSVEFVIAATAWVILKSLSFRYLLFYDPPFYPPTCSSIHYPIRSWYHLEDRPGASNTPPTWLHIDPLHVITQGLIPRLWISREGWDQTQEEHKETEQEEVNKGEKCRDDNSVYTEPERSLIQLFHIAVLVTGPYTHMVI